jgi:FtsZ-interacting cell division protein ZipA
MWTVLNQNQGADMSTIMIIMIAFFAVAAIVILVALGWVLVNKRTQHRRVKADEIRDQAKEETLRINRQTAAKARAAQAQADVKAAQASGLLHEADSHRSGVATSRDQLKEQWDRADALDPASQTPETAKSAEPTASN